MSVTSECSVITLAVVNDHPIVVEGIARAVERDGRLSVVETDTELGPSEAVDLVLYDAFAAGPRQFDDVASLAADPRWGRVVVFTWGLLPDQIREVLALGADSCLSKELSAEELTDALVRIHRGEQVTAPRPAQEAASMVDWPGRTHGLSPRESEVLSLIAQGFTNEQIARGCFLSINSVKTYIRSAYRKIGVDRRSQAVVWGLRNGLHPHRNGSPTP
ncbi:MAG: response regulator transcription factor [Nesterenkonia sp.]|uniref:response regulator transcription factor n=1 Tax=Nesterenkonia marinintestina TaxID=2979865 RepID=UPI0021C1BAB5|nr:response regulator transcription factor [Nesterenkonia sp. GX14115]MDO5492818.1 response regulator transcription factor [Nesterenkonia sp.]